MFPLRWRFLLHYFQQTHGKASRIFWDESQPDRDQPGSVHASWSERAVGSEEKGAFFDVGAQPLSCRRSQPAWFFQVFSWFPFPFASSYLGLKMLCHVWRVSVNRWCFCSALLLILIVELAIWRIVRCGDGSCTIYQLISNMLWDRLPTINHWRFVGKKRQSDNQPELRAQNYLARNRSGSGVHDTTASQCCKMWAGWAWIIGCCDNTNQCILTFVDSVICLKGSRIV